MKLMISALVKVILGIVLVGLLVFLPAGTLSFTAGWIFMGVLFVPLLILGILLFIKAPKLLEKRLESKEEEKTQKVVVAASALIFVGGFVVAGLDYRFSWSRVPFFVTIIAAVLFLVSYGLYVEVMRENAHLSRTVKVTDEQEVVSTGLYSVVRHPMYMATVLMFMMIPLILSSWISFIIFALYPFVLTFRIRNEEELLTRELKGYKEYKEKVKYRMIPFIW